MSYLHTGSRWSASTMSDCADDVNIVWVTLKWTETPSGGDIYNLEERKLTHDKWNFKRHFKPYSFSDLEPETCTCRIRKNRAKINEWKGLFLKKLWCYIGEEAKFSFIVWPRKGHWEGESGRYLLPGLPGLCALLPPIETLRRGRLQARDFLNTMYGARVNQRDFGGKMW